MSVDVLPATGSHFQQLHFQPRESLGMVMAKMSRQYSGTFAELTRLRESKVLELKQRLPEIYQQLASSIKYQGWLAIISGAFTGGCQMGASLARARPILSAVLRGMGEGGGAKGLHTLIESSSQAESQILQGKRSEKESQREAMIQGGNSADQAFQSMIQMVKEIVDIEKAMHQAMR